MAGTDANREKDPSSSAGNAVAGGSAPLDADDLNLVDDEDDFDADEAWAEMDEAERAASGDDDLNSAQRAEDDRDTKAASSASETEDQKTTDEATAQAESESEAQASGEQEDEETEDPWSGANETQRELYQAAQAEIDNLKRSTDGYRRNQAGLQKRIRELEQAQERIASAKPSDIDLETDEGWKKFQEEYPEVAGPIAARLAQNEQKIAELEKGQQTINTDIAEDRVEEQIDLLEQAHPDWLKTINDNQGRTRPEFLDWLQAQPKHIRDGAAQNADVIVDAEVAADVIGRFKAFRSEQSASSGKGTSGKDPNAGNGAEKAGAADGDKKEEQTGNLSGKRQRQLDASSAARSKGPGTANGIPEDGSPQELWDAWERYEQRHGIQ